LIEAVKDLQRWADQEEQRPGIIPRQRRHLRLLVEIIHTITLQRVLANEYLGMTWGKAIQPEDEVIPEVIGDFILDHLSEEDEVYISSLVRMGLAINREVLPQSCREFRLPEQDIEAIRELAQSYWAGRLQVSTSPEV
jgi:hypothetical protein